MPGIVRRVTSLPLGRMTYRSVPNPVRFCPISCPTVGGIAITLAAKITGITPAMLTLSGR